MARRDERQAHRHGGASAITVQIVADDPGVRARLASLVDGGDGDAQMLVVGSTPLAPAPGAAGGHGPDLVIAHAGSEGELDAVRALAGAHSRPFFVLIVSGLDGPHADGHAVDRVAVADRQRIPEIVPRLVRAAAGRSAPSDRAALRAAEQARLLELTPRERDVLALTAEGLSIKEIGRRLGRTEATVAKHRDNLMKKLGLHDKVALTRFAIRTGLIEP